jgi:hypothetical protein
MPRNSLKRDSSGPSGKLIYSGLSKANEALLAIKKLGYEDAFIKNLY